MIPQQHLLERGEHIMCYSSHGSESCQPSARDSKEPARTPESVLYPCKTGRQIQEDILEDILRDILDYTRQRISCTYLGYPKRISVMDKY